MSNARTLLRDPFRLLAKHTTKKNPLNPQKIGSLRLLLIATERLIKSRGECSDKDLCLKMADFSPMEQIQITSSNPYDPPAHLVATRSADATKPDYTSNGDLSSESENPSQFCSFCGHDTNDDPDPDGLSDSSEMESLSDGIEDPSSSMDDISSVEHAPKRQKTACTTLTLNALHNLSTQYSFDLTRSGDRKIASWAANALRKQQAHADEERRKRKAHADDEKHKWKAREEEERRKRKAHADDEKHKWKARDEERKARIIAPTAISEAVDDFFGRHEFERPCGDCGEETVTLIDFHVVRESQSTLTITCRSCFKAAVKESALAYTRCCMARARSRVWLYRAGLCSATALCALCQNPNARIHVYLDDWQVAHDLARARGGGDELDNLHIAHARCNRDQGTLSINEYRKYM